MTASVKRIGIDVDDVLADFKTGFRKLCRELVPDGKFDERDWDYGLTREQSKPVWDRIRNTPNFWSQLPRDKGASYSRINWLAQHAKLFFITYRFDTIGWTAERQTAWWLDRYYLLNYPTVLVGTHKGRTAELLGLTHFIDDKPANCLDVLMSTKDCKVFLRSQPDNEYFIEQRHGIRRVKDFNEFAKIVGEE